MQEKSILKLCKESAFAGSKAIECYKPKRARVKLGWVGHHSIVSSADFLSQASLLKVLDKHDSNSYFITEEHVKNPRFKKRLITENNLDILKTSGVYIIDELDGSSSFNIGHYEWSVSVGYVNRLVHVAGAISAPKVYGGALFSALRGNGAFIKTINGEERIKVREYKGLKNSYVVVGPDCFLPKYPSHNRMLLQLGDLARTMNGNGSCALALCLVAAGKADALIQPVQSPWDWAAGKVILEEAGGTMKFYEMQAERIIPIDKLRPKHYDPSLRSAGFVAGNKKIVQEIMKILVR